MRMLCLLNSCGRGGPFFASKTTLSRALLGARNHKPRSLGGRPARFWRPSRMDEEQQGAGRAHGRRHSRARAEQWRETNALR